jgi:TolA-binding protein
LVGDAAFLRGTIMASEDNVDEAYQEFRLVAEKYPESEFAPEALYKAGECLALQGRHDEAVNVFKSFVEKYPDNILAEEAKLRVGDAQFFAASFQEAVKGYKELLASPLDPAAERETLYRLAITYHNMQDYKASADTFRMILEKYPESPHRAEAHLRIGDFLIREGKDPVSAIDQYQAAYDADKTGPFSGRALKGLGLARYETSDYDGAAEIFLRVMQEHPSVALNESTYAWAGQRFFDQENWDAAGATFEALLKAFPEYANPERVRLMIAECAEKAGKAEAALGLYQAVVDEAPRSAAAIESKFRMAKLHEAGDGLEQAKALYEEVAKTNMGEAAARARFRLGELCEAAEEYEAAAKNYMYIEILLLHEELSPEALLRAGLCYEKAGSTEQALRAYQDVLEGYPDSEQAGRAKERLAQAEANQEAEPAATQ